MPNNTAKTISYGILGSAVLLGLYFAVLTLISGWNFTLNQFLEFWYFIVSLSVGFGVQIGLYVYLKNLVQQKHVPAKTVLASGATSTVAMISCCAHYLANLVPILGVVGMVTFIAQYQIELFWIGIFFNLAGIIYMVRRIRKVKTT